MSHDSTPQGEGAAEKPNRIRAMFNRLLGSKAVERDSGRLWNTLNFAYHHAESDRSYNVHYEKAPYHVHVKDVDFLPSSKYPITILSLPRLTSGDADRQSYRAYSHEPIVTSHGQLDWLVEEYFVVLTGLTGDEIHSSARRAPYAQPHSDQGVVDIPKSAEFFRLKVTHRDVDGADATYQDASDEVLAGQVNDVERRVGAILSALARPVDQAL